MSGATGAGAVAVEDAYTGEEESIDPLDAQNAGLHDEAYEQGHEEIVLNLEGFDAPEELAGGGEHASEPAGDGTAEEEKH